MRHLLVICAAVVVAPAFAQDKPAEAPVVPDEKIIEEEFFVPPGKLSRAERDAPAVSVRLKDGGRLQFQDGKEWKGASMAELSARLGKARQAYHAKLVKEGKSGLEDLPGGGKASKLFVSIQADPGVPWQHLQWLMTIAAEEKFYKLELSDGKRRLLAFLPTDRSIEPPPQVPPNVIKVAVHIVVRDEEKAKWGDVEVSRPTKFRYRFGNREVADLGSVAQWIKHATRAAAGTKNTFVEGEIRAGHKVPVATALDVMEAFLDQGVPAVSFFGVSIPGVNLRELATLPYPKANYPRGS